MGGVPRQRDPTRKSVRTRKQEVRSISDPAVRNQCRNAQQPAVGLNRPRAPTKIQIARDRFDPKPVAVLADVATEGQRARTRGDGHGLPNRVQTKVDGISPRSVDGVVKSVQVNGATTLWAQCRGIGQDIVCSTPNDARRGIIRHGSVSRISVCPHQHQHAWTILGDAKTHARNHRIHEQIVASTRTRLHGECAGRPEGEVSTDLPLSRPCGVEADIAPKGQGASATIDLASETRHRGDRQSSNRQVAPASSIGQRSCIATRPGGVDGDRPNGVGLAVKIQLSRATDRHRTSPHHVGARPRVLHHRSQRTEGAPNG